MMNFAASTWLKHSRMAIGGALLALSMTACGASDQTQASPQPSVPTSPAIESSSVPPASPIPSPSSPAPLPASPRPSAAGSSQAAVQVIQDYYSAINRRDYQQAYSAWEDNGAASQQTFEQFQRGFANTASVSVTVGEPTDSEGAAGSIYIEVPVTVTAVTRDGTPQRFRGSYVLRRVNDVPGSTSEQRQWHLHSATINQVN